MQLNIFSGTAKRVTKMTTKAKAALEEKAIGTSKKRKPDKTGLNTTTQLKKAKTHPAAGNTSPTSSLSLTAADKGPAHADEEEDTFNTDEVDSNLESGSQSSESKSESNEETAQDQLSTFSLTQ
jgi:hypothetical protein